MSALILTLVYHFIIAQGLLLYRSSPPSAADVEVMEICCKAQGQYIFEISIPVHSDDSLNAFWDAEAVGNDDEDATAESSHQQNINDESTAPQFEQETNSSTESDDILKA